MAESLSVFDRLSVGDGLVGMLILGGGLKLLDVMMVLYVVFVGELCAGFWIVFLVFGRSADHTSV